MELDTPLGSETRTRLFQLVIVLDTFVPCATTVSCLHLLARPLCLEGPRKTVRQKEDRAMHQRSSESTTAQAEFVFEQRPRLNLLRNRLHMHISCVQESISPQIVPIRSVDQLYLQAIIRKILKIHVNLKPDHVNQIMRLPDHVNMTWIVRQESINPKVRYSIANQPKSPYLHHYMKLISC